MKRERIVIVEFSGHGPRASRIIEGVRRLLALLRRVLLDVVNSSPLDVHP